MPRFVVLHHEFPAGHERGSHWDVMFESEGVLRTWAVRQTPDAPSPQPADALADHRLDYLSYEGPVSGDRGSVTRWDAGTYIRAAEAPAPGEPVMGRDKFGFQVAGARLRGTIELARSADGWHYRFVPEDGSSSD